MEVPSLGEVIEDAEFGWHRSKSIPIPMFGGKECQIVLDGYEEDTHQDEFHVAIVNFLSKGFDVLREADDALFLYYKDHEEYWDDSLPRVQNNEEIWKYVQFPEEAHISRRAYGDKTVYVSLECECAWEPEHGLQIVLKNGLTVNKIGPYDGHLTNADSYGNSLFEDVVYVGRNARFA